MSKISKASNAWPAPIKMSCMLTCANASQELIYAINWHVGNHRMNGVKSRAIGRHILSNLPSGTWESVLSAHESGQNAIRFHRPQVYPFYSFHVPCFPLLNIHTWVACNPSFQHPFPSAHSDLCSFQQNDITRAQSESRAGNREARIGWIWKSLML